MRIFSKMTGMAVLGLAMLCCANPGSAQGTEPVWVQLEDNAGHSEFYYDTSSIARLGKGVFRVTARIVYTPQGKAETLDLLKHAKEYDALVESRYVYNLDCRQGKSRLLNITHLGARNAEIKAFDLSGVTDWEEIPPAARLELITDEVCARK